MAGKTEAQLQEEFDDLQVAFDSLNKTSDELYSENQLLQVEKNKLLMASEHEKHARRNTLIFCTIIALLLGYCFYPFVRWESIQFPNRLPNPFSWNQSDLTAWTKQAMAEIPAKHRPAISGSLKEAISETLAEIDRGEFQDLVRTDPLGNKYTWKATDQARTNMSLLFQKKLSEAERNKNYQSADRKEAAQAASAFLLKLGQKLSDCSDGRDDLEIVKKLYGEVAKGL